MKLAILLLIAVVLVAGCTSTGQTTNQTIKEYQQVQPVQTTPVSHGCLDTIQCPSGMTCLKNICVRVQFVK